MDHVVKNLISVSSAPIAKLGGKRYYDLVGTLKVMQKVFREAVVDGFELQLQPEWDRETPPLTDTQFADWTTTPKYSVDEILRLVQRQSLPILSVHASRDVGAYLCSRRKQDQEKGRQLMHDAMYLAKELGAGVCVFHLWDTWKTRFNWQKLKQDWRDMTHPFAEVKASVENIPTHLEGYTPYALVKHFDYVTLDTKWASLYNELSKFDSMTAKIVNVHLRGRLRNDRWVLNSPHFGFYDALDRIRRSWQYQGLLTVEPEGERNIALFTSFLKAMKSLRPQSN